MNYKSESAKELASNIISGGELLLLTKPYIATTTPGLVDQMNNLGEEIASKGGYENLDSKHAIEYDIQTDTIMLEFSSRN